MVYEKVKNYIDESIFHSQNFDKLEDLQKQKAVKNAESLLYLMYKSYNPDDKPLPISAIAYQTIWIAGKNSAILQAEMGIASQSIEGMTQTFQQMDRTVAPEVKRILKKRVGSYSLSVPQTNRGVYFR